MKQMEEEWFCFIQEANFHTIDKHCLGITRSYYVATVGVHNKQVQNTQWHRLIQPRTLSTWPILYPTSVNESPQRLTTFICGFPRCHSVCSNIWEVYLCHDITYFNAANSEMFRVNTFMNFLFFSVGEKINKQLRRSIRFPL